MREPSWPAHLVLVLRDELVGESLRVQVEVRRVVAADTAREGGASRSGSGQTNAERQGTSGWSRRRREGQERCRTHLQRAAPVRPSKA